MFSSILAFCCIVALHFTAAEASHVHEKYALQGTDFEPYAGTVRAARPLYITVSSQYAPSSYTSGGVLYLIIAGSNTKSALTVSDRPTQSTSYVAPNGRLDITVTGSNSGTRVDYDGTQYQPAVDFLSVKIIGSNNHNSINVAGSSVTADGSLSITFDGSNNVNSVNVNNPSLRPADGQIALTGADNQNTVIDNGSSSSVTADGSLRITFDGSNNVNSVIANDPSLRPADRRLQISVTGSNNVNKVIVNGSVWPIIL